MKTKIKKITMLVTIIILFSSITYAIYIGLTIGNKKLSFNLIVATTNTTGGGENPITQENVNDPILDEGMIPIKYNGTNWVITNSEDVYWYNYNSASKSWANVMLSDGRYKVSGSDIVDSSNSNLIIETDGIQTIAEADLGSMFVWIPRYEYKINYTDATNVLLGGTISLNFITKDITTPTTGYTIHPAFTNGTNNSFANGEWDSEISGIWVAKFEASNSENEYLSTSTTVNIKSLPNRISWSNLSTTDAFTKCADMNALSNIYGLSVNDTEIDPHLTKNSEWGAIVYLAYSSYGRNATQPNINNFMTKSIPPRRTKTGVGGDGIQVAQVESINIPNINKYDGTTGVLASTTGNITGVYDMSGGLTEYIAGFYTGGTLGEYTTSTKYTTLYTVANLKTGGKTGDATSETYNWDSNMIGSGSGATSLSGTNKYLLRGGAPGNGTTTGKSGLFAYAVANGNQGEGGSSEDFRGFRATLIVGE